MRHALIVLALTLLVGCAAFAAVNYTDWFPESRQAVRSFFADW